MEKGGTTPFFTEGPGVLGVWSLNASPFTGVWPGFLGQVDLEAMFFWEDPQEEIQGSTGGEVHVTMMI